MYYTITNISHLSGNRLIKNTIATIQYRDGVRWKKYTLRPSNSITFFAHELNLITKSLEKRGIIKIESGESIPALTKAEIPKQPTIPATEIKIAEQQAEPIAEEPATGKTLEVVVEEIKTFEDAISESLIQEEAKQSESSKKERKAKIKGRSESEME